MEQPIHPAAQISAIEVLDHQGKVKARIVTARPGWSFEQYCRNRVSAGWSWRMVSAAG